MAEISELFEGEIFGQVNGSISASGEDMRQQKKNKHSNQAQLTGEFMSQKWRIYGLSDNLALERYKAHHPDSEFLFPPRHYVPGEDEENASPIILVSKARKPGPPHPFNDKQKKDGDVVTQQSLFEI